MLYRAQHRVKQKDCKYDHGAFGITGQHGNRCRCDQDNDQQVLKLGEEHLPPLKLSVLLQYIFPICPKPFFSLVLTDPLPSRAKAV